MHRFYRTVLRTKQQTLPSNTVFEKIVGLDNDDHGLPRIWDWILLKSFVWEDVKYKYYAYYFQTIHVLKQRTEVGIVLTQLKMC